MLLTVDSSECSLKTQNLARSEDLRDGQGAGFLRLHIGYCALVILLNPSAAPASKVEADRFSHM